ncbi:ABC transporter permease [Mesorhizobium sp. CAU 1732]|uniref:ABC transporter permease n=1 Tax=Mesorhizobium sp. CAU 1732 TaxID=3140358 RepID=UPI003261BC06
MTAPAPDTPSALDREGLVVAVDPWRAFVRRFARSRRSLVAFWTIVLVVGVAILAPWISIYDPNVGGTDALLPPLSAGHWLGTDHLGRDIWAQLAYGARVSLTVGVLAALSALTIGVLVGALSGYFGGWTDAVLMRVSEFFQTLPRFVVALIIVALFGAGLFKLVLVIGFLSWPQTARVVRSSVLTLRESTFVDAARVAGMGSRAIIFREILPNVAATIIVMTGLAIASAILLEAGLSFFGIGDPNMPSWGTMLNQAQEYLRLAWWMSLFPGLAIAIVVLSFNMISDGLNDALNPKLRDGS